MNPNSVDCRVVVPPEQQNGTFANAFRVMNTQDGEWLLDFLAITGDKRASIVARVRVDEDFLTSIRDRVSSSLADDEQSYGFLTPQQVEEIWYSVQNFPKSGVEEALPLLFVFPPHEKAN